MGQSSAPVPAGPAEPAMETLVSALRGKAIRPGDDAYDAARRVYNADIDCRPRLVVQCADVADVIHCINFAREEGLTPAVRCGGHSVPGFGTCEGGLVIDLSGMKGIRVDPVRRVARVDGGCTWGDLDHATHAFGLATPGGVISTTGVGGLTLGGGFGYLTRRYGLSCDNLISADVVTAGGRMLTASATENPELFWAIRGGGGNFGVVTSLEFRLHPVSMVYAGPALYPLEKGAEVLRFFGDFMAGAPRELSAFFAYLIVPPAPPFPEHLHGKTLCGIVYVYSGDLEEGERVTRPIREFGPPAFAVGHAAPYPAVQSMFDPLLPKGLYHYWKADFVDSLTGPVIAGHVRYGPEIPTVNSAVHIYPLDGAVHDVASGDTAFAYRDVNFVHVLAAVSPEPGPMPRYREWVRSYWSALHPHSAGGAYVNFLMEEGDERIAASYRGNYARLAAVKKEYDPANLFRRNQNIPPSA
ncbi:MAG: FAD-binding oxidoreductase [Acidobacteriia bacterium]|nr:FAD-binding oxidoreductase [Terriglobia bacterium]